MKLINSEDIKAALIPKGAMSDDDLQIRAFQLGWNDALEVILDSLGDAVVRCKDCKYSSHEPYKDQADVYVCNYSCWTRAEGGRYPDWYCARAERRTDERPES